MKQLKQESKQKSYKGKIIALALTSMLVLSACSNAGEKQDHSQHGSGETKKTQDHSQHGKQKNSTSEQSSHQGHGETQKPKVDTQWTTTIQKANQEGEVRIVIKDDQGNPIPDFKVSHEKKLHLIAVSEDLSYFDHVHPEWKGNGEFVVKTQFPQGGKYRLYADFIPKGGSQITAMHDLTVLGEPKKQPIQAEKTWTKTVDGKEITLDFAPKAKAKQETTLNFTLKDAKTKQPITNLEQYLGAVGHVVVISENTEQYLHVHPLEEGAKGPEAKFATEFPNKGVYKIWGQFQHQGKVITVPFVVNVSE